MGWSREMFRLFSQASDWIILYFSQFCIRGFSSPLESFLPVQRFDLSMAFHSVLDLVLGQKNCERFETRSHFKSRLSLIVRVNVVLNRTVIVDSD